MVFFMVPRNRLLLIFLSIHFCLAPAFASASAKTKYFISGDFDISMSHIKNSHFDKENHSDEFTPRQRLRLWLRAKTSDRLMVFAMLRIAAGEWGRGKFFDGKDVGYALDADGVNIRTRFLFLNWHDPLSPWIFRMGIIPVNLPFAAFPTGVLDTCAGGIEVIYNFNQNVGISVIWSRPFDEFGHDENNPGKKSGRKLDDAMDMFIVKLLLTFKETGVSFTPWGLYSLIGKDSGYWESVSVLKLHTMSTNGRGLWMGMATKIDLADDLRLNLDAAYAHLSTNGNDKNYNSKGWQTAASLNYKCGFGTPGLFGWYATGSDADKIRKQNQWGIVPSISPFDFSFDPTSFGFGEKYGINQNAVISAHPAGRWGIGAQIKDIKFIDNLSHTIRVAYYQGTNSKGVAELDPLTQFKSKVGGRDHILMTKKDHAFEVNFNHELNLYKQLTIGANLGFIQLYRDAVWKDKAGKHNALQSTVNFRYSF